LLVVLDDAGIPGLGFVRIEPRVTASPPLPEQVPALVQRLFDAAQATRIGLCERFELVLLAELVLLLDETVDVVDDRLVVHVDLLQVWEGLGPSPGRSNASSSK